MKSAFTVIMLLLTGTMILISAEPGRGTGQAGRAEHSARDVSAVLISGITTRVSVASDGTGSNGASGGASISADGRFVAFTSYATNLVRGDNNGVVDVFVHDRASNETTRVSITSDGTEGNEESYGASISAGGRFVAFTSYATNLVRGDNNGVADVFVHDRASGETTRVSIASDGSEGNDESYGASISADGRFVAFGSTASNLVINDNNNSCNPSDSNCSDIFVRDLDTGETARVSVASDGAEGNGESYGASISGDGRFVAFTSTATNLVNDADNFYPDVFVHDRAGGETTRVSMASDGTEANGASGGASLSADGRIVAFASWADNLVNDDDNRCYLGDVPCSDIFVRDRYGGETTRVSVASDGTQANGESFRASISSDGQFVAFDSDATNLVSDDNQDFDWCRHGSHDDSNCDDVFVHDRHTGETFRVSVASDGTEANDDTYGASISADGRIVAFSSWANNLVNDDSNDTADVFVHNRDITRTFLPLIRQ